MLLSLCTPTVPPCRTGAEGGGRQAPGSAGAAKSLAALPEEGAMRPLVESLLEGRWAAGEEASSSRLGLGGLAGAGLCTWAGGALG